VWDKGRRKKKILTHKYDFDNKVNVDQHEILSIKPSHNHERNALRERYVLEILYFNKILFLYKINMLAAMGGPRGAPAAP
jgi:hypothetical protein